VKPSLNTGESRTTGKSAGYDWHQTYDWNYAHVPEPVPQQEPAVSGTWSFCGLPVGSPLGIAAGPLLNGRWILFYASLGFDVLTYKTVRSRPRACYPLPNLQPIGAPLVRGGEAAIEARNMMRDSWAVSFGMPSKSPEVWRADIESTRRALPRIKILNVSVVATPQDDWTLDDVAADFARCAKWAVESGADSVEANFSCPNVASADAQLYQQPEAAAVVAASVREAVGARPFLIKIGHVTDAQAASELVRAIAPHANALVMVNCITARVLGANRQPLFDGQRRGIAGAAIRDAALQQVRLFARVIRQEGPALQVIGVGGISTAADVRAHLAAGASGVQLATAAMLDPEMGLNLRRELAETA
jgi:dihydroorotate dehydrogenase